VRIYTVFLFFFFSFLTNLKAEEFIEDMRAELSDYEFKVLYESEFVEDSQDSLIRWD
jgi:hypothetical protein